MAPVLPDRPRLRLAAIDGRAIGLAVIGLGGGRRRPDEAIDPGVGFSDMAGLGETVDAARPLCLVHAADAASAARAAAQMRAAVRLADAAPPAAPPVRERIA